MDFVVLALGFMTNLFSFSCTFLDLIFLNLGLDFYLNKISIDLDHKLMRRY